MNPPQNNYDHLMPKRGKGEEEGQRKLRYGIGKRMDLKEMLMLYKYTKQSTMSQMGMNYMPAGTKAPPMQPSVSAKK